MDDTPPGLAIQCHGADAQRDRGPPPDRSELYVADEVFFCGTGVQFAVVAEIDRRPVGNGTMGPVTGRLRRLYLDVVRGRPGPKVPPLVHACVR